MRRHACHRRVGRPGCRVDVIHVWRSGGAERLAPEHERLIAEVVRDLEGMRDFTRDNVLIGSLTAYLAIEDFDYIYAVLAAGVTPVIQDAEYPPWLMVVGPPSGGKTQARQAARRHPAGRTGKPLGPPRRTVDRVNDLTLPGLLRVARPPKLATVSPHALPGHGGRVARGDRLLLDARRQLALRRYQVRPIRGPARHLRRSLREGERRRKGRVAGTALGRRRLHPAIDNFTAYASALGDRFVYYRLPETSEEQRRRMTDLVGERQNVEQLRAAAANVAAEFIAAARARVAAGLELPEEFGERIGDLANLACYGRGTVRVTRSARATSTACRTWKIRDA